MRSSSANQRSRQKKKSIIPWLMILLFFIGVSVGSAYLLRYGLLYWNFTRLKEVKIKNADYINANKLKFEIEAYLGENIFVIEDNSIEQIASEFSGIENINIVRKFPDKLFVYVNECTPIAYVKTKDDKYFIIDDVGKVLEEKKDRLEYPFPTFTHLELENLTPGTVITKNSLKEIIKVYKIVEEKYPALLKSIDKFYFGNEGVILTEHKRGIRFIVGKEDFPDRVDKLDFAYTNFSINAFSEIDLRFSDIKNDLIILR